jgi:hypothetical protein
MVNQDIHDFDRARRKAAERTGISDKRMWPSNGEIEEARLQQRRLFEGGESDQVLKILREHALTTMRSLTEFTPRLVGPVLRGNPDSTRGVRLHLFTDNPEEVVLTLIDRGIPWRQGEALLRFGGGKRNAHPLLTFLAGQVPFEFVVLPLGALRNPPLDPVSERPERGAGISEVVRLMSVAS